MIFSEPAGSFVQRHREDWVRTEAELRDLPHAGDAWSGYVITNLRSAGGPKRITSVVNELGASFRAGSRQRLREVKVGILKCIGDLIRSGKIRRYRRCFVIAD